MIGTVLVNGELSDGRISVTDSSVLRGDGCFEVMKAYSGKVFALEPHLERLQLSASKLFLELPSIETIAMWVEKIAAEQRDGAVRVVVTRGSSLPGDAEDVQVIVFGHPWERDSAPTRLLPVGAPWHGGGEDWELAGAKVLSYAPHMSASRRAHQEGFDDALLLTTDGRILEGPTFTVAWVLDDVLETPSLDVGILDSITRRVVLEEATKVIEVVEGIWKLDRILRASEMMAFSTTREVQSVSAVGDLVFSQGPVTNQLHEAFLTLVG